MKAARISLLAALWLLSGCSGAGRSLVPDGSSVASPDAVDLPAAVLDPVIADIARVAGVPAVQVIVVAAAPVTFPDGALGCPVPGMLYTQILVDGYKIVATANGQTYDYRGSAPGTFRRCETPG